MKYVLTLIVMVLVGHCEANGLESQALSGAFLRTAGRAKIGNDNPLIVSVSAQKQGAGTCYGSIYLPGPGGFLEGGRLRLIHHSLGPSAAVPHELKKRMFINIPQIAHYLQESKEYIACKTKLGKTKLPTGSEKWCVAYAVTNAYCADGDHFKSLQGDQRRLAIKSNDRDYAKCIGKLDQTTIETINEGNIKIKKGVYNTMSRIAGLLIKKPSAAVPATSSTQLAEPLHSAIKLIKSAADIPKSFNKDVTMLELIVKDEELTGFHLSRGHLVSVHGTNNQPVTLTDEDILALKTKVAGCEDKNIKTEKNKEIKAVKVKEANACLRKYLENPTDAPSLKEKLEAHLCN